VRNAWRWAALGWLCAGCVSIPADYGLHAGNVTGVELAETPFFPQARYQCGPAALATILTASGVNTDPASLVERVYVPARKGTLQVELLAATRAAGRIAYRLDAGLNAVAAELKAGRPVLVLQNLGVAWLPRWHYAVVIGVDVERDRIVLRSGTERRRETPVKTFLRTWQRGDYWALVALEPGDLPANPSRERYFKAIADLESAARPAEAGTAWAAAIEHWPNDPVPVFGLANAALAAGEFRRAEQLYRQLVEQDSQHHRAINNLAYALERQGKREAALNLLGDAIAVFADSPAKQALLRNSRDDIRSASK